VSHASPENKAFLEQLVKGGGKLDEVTMTAVAAYDGARLIYKMIEATNGQRDPQKAVAAVKDMKWVSPPRAGVDRSPIPATSARNVYLREVAKQDGKLINKELQTFDAQPDWALSRTDRTKTVRRRAARASRRFENVCGLCGPMRTFGDEPGIRRMRSCERS